MNLKRRVEEIESAESVRVLPMLVIRLAPDELISRVTCGSQVWRRRDSEDFDTLLARAQAEANRPTDTRATLGFICEAEA